MDGHQRLFYFTGSPPDGKDVSPPEDLDAEGIFNGPKILVVLPKEPERFIRPLEVNLFGYHRVSRTI